MFALDVNIFNNQNELHDNQKHRDHGMDCKQNRAVGAGMVLGFWILASVVELWYVCYHIFCVQEKKWVRN